MAVVSIYGEYGRAAAEATPPGQADTRYSGQPLMPLLEKVSFVAGNSTTSKASIGKLPSHAVIDPSSKVYFGAAGGTATFDIGDVNDPDGLATDIDMSAAGSADLLEAVAAADKLDPLWTHLGYATDPGGQLDLYISVATAAVTNSFSVTTAIRWSA
jgi:hypothetical protein